MKSLTAPELVSFCEWLRERLTLAQLQDLWTDGKFFVLQFYLRRELFLIIDLQPNAPVFWLQERKPRVPKSPKPAGLFLASHGRGRLLKDLQVLLDRGRTALFVLGTEDNPCDVQIDLIPKNPNLVIRAAGKEIFWNKPKDLPAPVLPDLDPVERDWESWCLEMERKKFSRPQDSAAPREGAGPDREWVRGIEKKRKAVEALTLQLGSRDGDRYRELGEALKISSRVPAELADLYDAKKSVAENREAAFRKAKDLERKKDGTRDRLKKLEEEIAALQGRIDRGENYRMPQASTAARLMKKGEAQGRKLTLENGLEAALGKSGADNLAILRQARAWDLWVHLKDEPGAHAILFRNRDQEVPESAIRQVAEWVWQESRGKRSMGGAKYQVLVVECRFVKPIKGDRLGRVTYQNPRVYTFASKTDS